MSSLYLILESAGVFPFALCAGHGDLIAPE